jgi:hypothetical protein
MPLRSLVPRVTGAGEEALNVVQAPGGIALKALKRRRPTRERRVQNGRAAPDLRILARNLHNAHEWTSRIAGHVYPHGPESAQRTEDIFHHQRRHAQFTHRGDNRRTAEQSLHIASVGHAATYTSSA